MEAKVPITDAAAELTKQVGELFKAHYPLLCPNEAQCYRLAVFISVVRNSNYKKNFEKNNVQLRNRRAVLEGTKRLIKDQKNALNVHLETLKLSAWLEDLENLQAFEAALKKVETALLQPFDPFAGERNGAWGHKAVLMIAQRARAALKIAGHPEVSHQKHGEFVVLVAEVLKLAGIKYAPSTVSSILDNANQ